MMAGRMMAVAGFSGVGLGFVNVVPGASGMRVAGMFFGVADSLERSREESCGVTELSPVDLAGAITGVIVE
jgi:hypothetical protein